MLAAVSVSVEASYFHFHILLFRTAASFRIKAHSISISISIVSVSILHATVVLRSPHLRISSSPAAYRPLLKLILGMMQRRSITSSRLLAALVIAVILAVSILRSLLMLSQQALLGPVGALVEKKKTSTTQILDDDSRSHEKNWTTTSPPDETSILLPLTTNESSRPMVAQNESSGTVTTTQLPQQQQQDEKEKKKTNNENENANANACTPIPHQPLYKVRGLFENFVNFTRFLDTSSGAADGTRRNEQPVVCEFKNARGIFRHFAHAMQQLYGCYSVYQEQHDKEGGRNHHRPNILLLPSEMKPHFNSNSFLKGYLQFLQDGMSVEILDSGSNNTSLLERYPQFVNVSFAMMYEPGGYLISHVHELNQLLQQYISKMKDTTTPPHVDAEPPRSCGMKKDEGYDNAANATFPRIGVLNRSPKSGRSISNTAQLVNAIANLSLHQQVGIEYFESSSFEEQVEFFQKTDILISPHGAQLTGTPFLAKGDKCSQLLEIFPPNYLIPAFYGSLARNSDIGYSYLYLSDEAPPAPAVSHGDAPKVFPETIEQRKKVRGVNLCVPVDVIQQSIERLVADWRECCLHAEAA